MRPRDIEVIAGAFAGLVACATALPGWAQTFPARPVRFVVPFAPGGPADVSARTIAIKLTEALGQNIVIDNRPGAGGIVAAEIVAAAKHDGHTILLCSTSVMVINPIVSKVSYDPLRDLAPVSLVSSSPYVLLTHAAFPARTVQELIAAARAKPGSLNYGSAGIGSTSHLVAEIFRGMAGIEATHVPYKGSALAATDLIGGQIQMLFESVSSALPNIQSGRLRALGISSRTRSKLTPQLPTIAEAGVPGYEAITWQGVCAPGATPAPIVDVLNRAVVSAARAPATVERFAALGAESVGSSAAEFAAYVKTEIPRWSRAIRASGAKAQ
jgi:tripartite-type tricarboxylate transporter receptor subunit TctC